MTPCISIEPVVCGRILNFDDDNARNYTIATQKAYRHTDRYNEWIVRCHNIESLKFQKPLKGLC